MEASRKTFSPGAGTVGKGEGGRGRAAEAVRGGDAGKSLWEAIDEFAAVLGCDPSGFTLRSLSRMALFRQRADWDRTASLLSALYNLNRDPSRSRPMSPADFNPYRMREAGRAATVATPKEAAEIFKALAGGMGKV